MMDAGESADLGDEQLPRADEALTTPERQEGETVGAGARTEGEEQRWLRALESFIQGRRSVHTRRAYTESLKQFLAFLQSRGRTLATATPADVGAFVDALMMGPPRMNGAPTLSAPVAGAGQASGKKTPQRVARRSSGTAQNRVTAISSFYRYCMRVAKLTNSNPCDGIEWPKATHRTRSALPLPHAQALLQAPARAAQEQPVLLTGTALDQQESAESVSGTGGLRLDERRVARDRLILGLLMIEGLREAEVAALRLEWIRRIYDREGTAYLTIEVTGKGSKLRSLVLAERTGLLLEAYLKVHGRRLGESGPLFPAGRAGRPRRTRPDDWIELLPPAEDHLTPTRIRQLVYDYAQRVLPPEMRIGPHHLRHTAVTDWLDEGAGLREAQLHAGHSSPVTTQNIYDHASLRPERSASRKGRLGRVERAQQDGK